MRIVTFLLILGLFFSACEKKEKESGADFEHCMGSGGPDWEALVHHRGSYERIQILKCAYDEKRSLPASERKIPKIIHQIWLGPKSPPSYYWEYKKGWEKRHPDWEYRLWLDKDVDALDFELKDLYNRSTSWGEKSDILRAEILDRFGGLYVDVDFENVKPFDELHMKYDFYAGLEPPHQGDLSQPAPHVVISDALIGAAPHHPIIKEWKVLMRKEWDVVEKRLPDSPKRVLLRTFYPFGDAVMKYIQDPCMSNIIFPSTYFYPLTFTQVSKGRIKKINFFKRQLQNIYSLFEKERPAFVELQPETMAVHYWGNSWVKSNEERFREMHRDLLSLESQMEQSRAKLEEEITELRKQVESLKENG